MKISIIIPAFNREPYIGPALRSLLRQTDAADLDIIVVDDGSTDRTVDVVEEYAGKNSSIRLVRQDHVGVARARNTGLDNIAPDADLVTFLDSDDISAPGRFATEIPYFLADPKLDMTYSLMTLAHEIDNDDLAPPENVLQCTMRGISLTTALFRKSAIQALGRFDENLKQAEDWEFLLRFFTRPQKHLMLDHVSIFYRRHPGNTTRNAEESRRYFLKVILDHAQKRMRDPSLGDIPRFFDYMALADDRYASLR
ncbi:glycosyl transferase family 2 [Terrihabitans soli]|uniref:Glycosyl transferase family 2 n=1 Tax=Terrihabitans soli TaxID=708113 RepID=A0A6S6QYV3_9HYPH|nr:glycosyltransferase family A protein [Terrihabitans soli]BCJ92211.1 glycosyl transferase family 2 [Terrihabitans soli]